MGREARGRSRTVPSDGSRPWGQDDLTLDRDRQHQWRVEGLLRRKRRRVPEEYGRQATDHDRSGGVHGLRARRARRRPCGLPRQEREGSRRHLARRPRTERDRSGRLSPFADRTQPLRDGAAGRSRVDRSRSRDRSGRSGGTGRRRRSGGWGRKGRWRRRERRTRPADSRRRFHDGPASRRAGAAQRHRIRRVLRIPLQPRTRTIRRAQTPGGRPGTAAVVHAHRRHTDLHGGARVSGRPHAAHPQRRRHRGRQRPAAPAHVRGVRRALRSRRLRRRGSHADTAARGVRARPAG